jgi:hypothetical protein
LRTVLTALARLHRAGEDDLTQAARESRKILTIADGVAFLRARILRPAVPVREHCWYLRQKVAQEHRSSEHTILAGDGRRPPRSGKTRSR